MTPQSKKRREAPAEKEATFRCKFCGKLKPIAEMRVLTRFYPVLVACAECDRKQQ